MRIVSKGNKDHKKPKKPTSIKDVLGGNIPPNLKIALDVVSEPVIQMNIFGAHEQYIVRANTIEIARFSESQSAHIYVELLRRHNFKPFLETRQGIALLNIMALESMGGKLNHVDISKDGKSIIIDDLTKKKIL